MASLLDERLAALQGSLEAHGNIQDLLFRYLTAQGYDQPTMPAKLRAWAANNGIEYIYADEQAPLV